MAFLQRHVACKAGLRLHAGPPASILLFAGGCLSAILIEFYAPPPLQKGGGEMLMIAENLAANGFFGNPFASGSTGPTAVVAPLYPTFLAIMLRVFGDLAGALIGAVSVLVAGLHAALLPAVSRTFLGDERAGLWGGLLFIVTPHITIMPTWEAWPAAVALMGFCILCPWLVSSASRGTCLVTGGLLGILALLNPTASSVGLAWLAATVVRSHGLTKRAARFGGLAALAAMLICAPWMLRNKQLLQTFSIKNNAGMTLYASNNDCAVSNMTENLLKGCYGAYHPDRSPAELEAISRMGEGEYDRSRRQAAAEWILREPWRFAQLTFQRFVEFWFPNKIYHIYAYSVWLLTTLGVAGGLLAARWWRPGLLFLVFASLLYSAPYYVVVSDVRYRYPVLWITLVLAGLLISRGHAWISQRVEPHV